MGKKEGAAGNARVPRETILILAASADVSVSGKATSKLCDLQYKQREAERLRTDNVCLVCAGRVEGIVPTHLHTAASSPVSTLIQFVCLCISAVWFVCSLFVY